MALTLIIGNKNYSSWSLRPWLALTAVAGFGVLVGDWLHKRVPLWRIGLLGGAVLGILAAVTVVELVRG